MPGRKTSPRKKKEAIGVKGILTKLFSCYGNVELKLDDKSPKLVVFVKFTDVKKEDIRRAKTQLENMGIVCAVSGEILSAGDAQFCTGNVVLSADDWDAIIQSAAAPAPVAAVPASGAAASAAVAVVAEPTAATTPVKKKPESESKFAATAIAPTSTSEPAAPAAAASESEKVSGHEYSPLGSLAVLFLTPGGVVAALGLGMTLTGAGIPIGLPLLISGVALLVAGLACAIAKAIISFIDGVKAEAKGLPQKASVTGVDALHDHSGTAANPAIFDVRASGSEVSIEPVAPAAEQPDSAPANCISSLLATFGWSCCRRPNLPATCEDTTAAKTATVAAKEPDSASARCDAGSSRGLLGRFFGVFSREQSGHKPERRDLLNSGSQQLSATSTP